MNVLQIKNAIDTYNLKAQVYQSLFREFDFQGFFKMAAQMNSLLSYQLQKKENPLAVPEVRSFSAFTTFQNFLSNHVMGCYSDRYRLQELSDFMEAYEAVPERYRSILVGWKPEKEQVMLCHKVLADGEYFMVYGKENMYSCMEEYLDTVLAKSLPNMKADDIRGFVGLGYLTEDRLEGFRQRGILPGAEKLTGVYEALGLEPPKVLIKTGIKAVGTTFRTKSGASRQELLIELNSSQEKEQLTLEPYLFRKEGHPDTQAISVQWKGEDIANLSQATVDDIYGQLADPQFRLVDYEVIGGYSSTSSYGIKLSFEAKGMPHREESKSDTESYQRAVTQANPMNI